MSAFRFAKQAFVTEKPHSSITDWIDILTGSSIKEEAYDGIPELVDAINLQSSSGPAEASRALRKKLKHGNAHQQYRALMILKALVENCGEGFRTILQDGPLTDALRNLATDPDTDKRVKKKLQLVSGSLSDQYKGDPTMQTVANISKILRTKKPVEQNESANVGVIEDTKVREKEKKHAKEKEKADRPKTGQRQKLKRAQFNFEKDKPKVMESIVEGSQASSNLVNAITLVNRKTDSLEKNARVQECLEHAKNSRKPIVRYIQLVENEDIIGTLIETNDRLVAAIEMYNRLSVSEVDADPESTKVAKAMATVHIEAPNREGFSSPFDNKSSEDGEGVKSVPHVHPDLEDISFGALESKLPAPIRPSHLSDDGDDDQNEHRPSLSDFSDYESSDEETHRQNAGPSRRNYVTVSDDEGGVHVPLGSSSGNVAEDDPFADPFADELKVHQ